MGEALHGARETLPTFRAHNEQAMAHSAIAYAKAMRRRRMMACTTSIGPGATNMVTAGAVAHVNRLPVLLLPGDVFASRRPDPVLQQVEDFGDGTVSANDCFRPVSRYFDRITRPEQIMPALERAIAVLTDPGRMRARDAGASARTCRRRPTTIPSASSPRGCAASAARRPTPTSSTPPSRCWPRAKKPVIVAGGGVLYSGAETTLAAFAETARHPGRRDPGRQVLAARRAIRTPWARSA